MVGIIIIFAFVMSFIINFVEKKTGFQDEDDMIEEARKNKTEVAKINEP